MITTSVEHVSHCVHSCFEFFCSNSPFHDIHHALQVAGEDLESLFQRSNVYSIKNGNAQPVHGLVSVLARHAEIP